ncbi:hypothetical protein E2C01_021676 [Portunus trituberculatus]|uniref:Uncharacterized protein n=1 Tax=Portunus trituberculatus TaxID=210409 RepID=A0A5B7E3C7_PORTR|nr:hypothetical protein [Portunus trituberculatus]
MIIINVHILINWLVNDLCVKRIQAVTATTTGTEYSARKLMSRTTTVGPFTRSLIYFLHLRFRDSFACRNHCPTSNDLRYRSRHLSEEIANMHDNREFLFVKCTLNSVATLGICSRL